MCTFHPHSGIKEKDCKSCECPDSLIRHKPDENGICRLCGQRALLGGRDMDIRQCAQCGGSGKRDCPFCTAGCPVCGYTGKATCPDCKGKGSR